MADPITELRQEVYANLSGYAPLRAIAEVYDEVPQGLETARLPYVTLGPMIYNIENIDCIDGGEIMIQIDAWSQEPGQAEVSTLAGLVRNALKGFAPDLTENALVEFIQDRTDFLRDGEIKHASIRFRAIVEESAAS